MLPTLIKRLEEARGTAARLERAVATELRHELAHLPRRFGFPNTRAFLKAVSQAARPARKRRRRAVITPAMQAKVLQLVKTGATAKKIARAAGISIASVQNIKHRAGLVRKPKVRKNGPKPRAKPPVPEVSTEPVLAQ